jgi:hypothetical protein
MFVPMERYWQKTHSCDIKVLVRAIQKIQPRFKFLISRSNTKVNFKEYLCDMSKPQYLQFKRYSPRCKLSVCQTPRSQGQIVTRNTHVKYKSSSAYHSKVIATVLGGWQNYRQDKNNRNSWYDRKGWGTDILCVSPLACISKANSNYVTICVNMRQANNAIMC